MAVVSAPSLSFSKFLASVNAWAGSVCPMAPRAAPSTAYDWLVKACLKMSILPVAFNFPNAVIAAARTKVLSSVCASEVSTGSAALWISSLLMCNALIALIRNL